MDVSPISEPMEAPDGLEDDLGQSFEELVRAGELNLESREASAEVSPEFELIAEEPAVKLPEAERPLVPDASPPVRQPVMTGTAWEHAMAQTFFNAVSPNDSLVLPWESGPMKEIFSPSFLPPTIKANGDASNIRDLRPSEPKPVVGHRDSVYEGSPTPAYMKAVRNIKDTEYMENKRVQLDLSVAKWMDLLSVSWDSSSVGAQLKLDLQADPSGHYADATLRSVFGVKSPTTLLKRAASMGQFMRWFAKYTRDQEVHIAPLPLREHDVWAYFLHLKDTRLATNRGYTISSTFLETVRFCQHVLGMSSCDSILSSKRLIGFAALERQQKGPVKQAPPMEAEHLLALHNILEHGTNKIDRIGAGCFLVATYARARWSDLRFAHHIKYDGFKRNATFDIYTSEHKTSSVGLRRQQFLPLVVPAEGIGGNDWLGTWIRLMKESGVDWDKVPFGPLLPAPKGEDEWFARPLSTNEAAVWLRKLLEGLPGADELRAHSMKATLCVWVARAGFSKEHRAILSHHSSALHGSDVVYSRDLQTGAITRLQMLLRKIRLGLGSGEEQLVEEQKRITSTFDSKMTSAVVTPVLGSPCPETPALALGQTAKNIEPIGGSEQLVERVADHDELHPNGWTGPETLEKSGIKDEEDFEGQCFRESANFSIFSAQELSSGLIQIDSSSGSDSESNSGETTGSDSDGSALEGFKDRAFVEEVPTGQTFYVHKKSRIVHRMLDGSNACVCKLKIGSNHERLGVKLHFRFPKCSRCFPDRHAGGDATSHGDDSAGRLFKRQKAF